MGRPKQMMLRHGVSLGEISVNVLAAHLDEVVLAGSGPVPDALLDRKLLDDEPAAKGPLAGILAAMRFRTDRAWLVAACDMPQISAEAVGWLLEQRRDGTWAVLPRGESTRVEPLLAVYEPGIRPLLEERAASGWWGFQPLSDLDEVVCPEIPTDLTNSWSNVNTPEQILQSTGLDV